MGQHVPTHSRLVNHDDRAIALFNFNLGATVTRFSWPAAESRYATIARQLGCCPADSPDPVAAAALVEGLEQLNLELRVPRLRDCPGINEPRFRSVLTKMANDALASGSPQNNPRIPTAEEIIALYEAAW